jgi:hypothetical protein
MHLQAQQLSTENEKLLEEARTRYYSLAEHGLESFKCSVHFDVTTVPQSLLPETAVDDRKLLGATSYTIEVGHAAPVVQTVFPVGFSPVMQQNVSKSRL